MAPNDFAATLQAHQEGRLREAEAGYRGILKRDPRHVEALYLLGVLLHQSGRHRDAQGFLERAIARTAQRPEFFNTLGDIHRVLGALTEAEQHFASALALRPLYPEAQQNLAMTLNAAGRTNEALVLLFNAVAAQPTHAPLRALLATMLRGVALGSGNVLVREVLRLLVADSEISAQSLAGAVLGLLKHDAAFIAVQEALQRNNALVELSDSARTLMRDPLLLGILPQIVIHDGDVEHVLVYLRRAAMGHATWEDDLARPEPATDLAFLGALAMQCFNTEYAFARSPLEHRDMVRLQGGLERALRDAASPLRLEPSLLLFAQYAPLHHLQGFQRLGDVPIDAWSDAMRLVIHTQVLDQVEEQRMAESLLNHGQMARDVVSEQVRAMYEEHPYPRWVALPQTAITTVPAFVHSLRPGLSPVVVPSTILVAGCGTGQQPVQMARTFPDASITAFDLSLASLAYASRMARHFGVAERVHFQSLDVLELDGPPVYGIVACTGVLHHLREPLEGWRRLVHVLAPEGIMKIGLYSTIARANINAARDFVRREGFATDDDGIRACRAAIMALPAGHPARSALAFTDFFSLSGCRDLLMHVQERSYTIAEIATDLGTLGLRFLGFQLPQPVQVRFVAEQGRDAMQDLAAWDRFERTHPETFAGMYQFWCCHAPADQRILPT